MKKSEINVFEIEDDILYWEPRAKNIKINLSTVFPVRTKCKYCGTGPTHYFAHPVVYKWFNPTKARDNFKYIQKTLKRMNYDYYLKESPKIFRATVHLTHTVNYKGYNPALHRKRGVPPINDYLEMMVCGCGISQWAYSQKSSVARPEITQRRARYSYPAKFKDW